MGSSQKEETTQSSQTATAEGNEANQAELDSINQKLKSLPKKRSARGGGNIGTDKDAFGNPAGGGNIGTDKDAFGNPAGGAVENPERAALLKRQAELMKMVSGAIKVSDLEKSARGIQEQNLTQFNEFVQAGPGQEDITAALGAQRGLADTLKQFSEGGFLPTEQDFQTAQQFTQSAFAPQQEQMNQQFAQQQTEAKRLSAQLGRPVNDPVIQAKLAQQQSQQQSMLGAQQTAFGSQFALNLPQQRLGFQAQGASVLQDLANRAQTNRQVALSLGSSIQNLERNFRLDAGLKNSNSTTKTTSSANAFDVIGGALGVASAIGTGGASLGLFGAAGAVGGAGAAAGAIGGASQLANVSNVALPGSSPFSQQANSTGRVSSNLSAPRTGRLPSQFGGN